MLLFLLVGVKGVRIVPLFFFELRGADRIYCPALSTAFFWIVPFSSGLCVPIGSMSFRSFLNLPLS